MNRSGILLCAFLIAVCLIHPGNVSGSDNTIQTSNDNSEIINLVKKAGNADKDEDRLNYLLQLQKKKNLSPELSKDLQELIDFVDLWVNPNKEIRPDPENRKRAAENGYLCYYFLYDNFQSRYIYSQIPKESPLYPIARLYEAREIMWATYQSGSIWGVPEKRDRNLARALECFNIVHETFPENRIARMHLGEPIPWSKYPVISSAPEWAVLQREGLEKLADIIEWWIDNRMLENGEFGGGWGDDCEMYRWWAPVLFGFHEPKIEQAQAKFSRAVLSQPHHTEGYTTFLSDVEHTAEDTGDTITPMMLIEADNPEWSTRAVRLVELMENVWTGYNEHGYLQFKSTYFNVNRVSDKPELACDTPRHLAAMQPALLYWLRTGDKNVERVVTAWMDCWVEATAREDGGKPAGIIPGSIYWPDGSMSRGNAVWWEPKNNPEPALYRWPTSVNWVTDTLLQTYQMTGDSKYLAPLRSMASIRLNYLQNQNRKSEPAPGSLTWCAEHMGSRLSGTLAKYRFLTGNKEFDNLLEKDASPYVRYRLYDEMSGLLEALKQNADAVSQNFEAFTSEVRYTDRVMVWPSRWLRTTGIDPNAQSINSGLLYSMSTGDVGDFSYFPMNAVRWLTPPRDIAVLVTDTGKRFNAQLFHFGTGKRHMEAELFLLPSGTYTMSIFLPENSDKPVSRPVTFTVSGVKSKIEFDLPAQKLCILKIEPI